MNIEYGYIIVIPIALLISCWCFYDTTCRGGCTRHRNSDESESSEKSDIESKSEEM